MFAPQRARVPARRGNVRGDAVGFLDGCRHLESGVRAANSVVPGGHCVDAHPVRRAVRQHDRQRVVGQVLLALVGHLSLDLRVITGQRGGGAVGLGRAQGRPDRAVGTGGETPDHPGVAVGRRVGEVVSNHLGYVVGHPRVDGGAPLDVGAVVGLLVDAEGGADDDCRRDDPRVDGVVERFLNLRALHRAVGLARVAVEKLDDRVGLAVGGGVVARSDDEDG